MSSQSLMRREVAEDDRADEGGSGPPPQAKWLRAAVEACGKQSVAASLLGITTKRLGDWMSGARTFSFNAVRPLLEREPAAAEAWVNAQAHEFALLPTRRRPELSSREVRRRAISLIRSRPDLLRELTDEFEETTDVIRFSLDDITGVHEVG